MQTIILHLWGIFIFLIKLHWTYSFTKEKCMLWLILVESPGFYHWREICTLESWTVRINILIVLKDFFCQFFNKYYFNIKGNKWFMTLNNVILFYFKFQISHKNWIKSQQNSWEHISWNVLWVLLLFDRALLLLNCTETEVTFPWKDLLNMGNITWINEDPSITWVKKRKTTES